MNKLLDHLISLKKLYSKEYFLENQNQGVFLLDVILDNLDFSWQEYNEIQIIFLKSMNNSSYEEFNLTAASEASEEIFEFGRNATYEEFVEVLDRAIRYANLMVFS